MQLFLRRLAVAAALSACVELTLPAQAQREHHDSADRHESRDHGNHVHFHGRDWHGFSPHERDVWRGGHWDHGWHDGRFAWWWVADGGWYFYPEPVYPYPSYVPPAIVVQQPPPVPSGLPPAQFWYFCDNPSGYYPYVATCTVQWRQVPATPAR